MDLLPTDIIKEIAHWLKSTYMLSLLSTSKRYHEIRADDNFWLQREWTGNISKWVWSYGQKRGSPPNFDPKWSYRRMMYGPNCRYERYKVVPDDETSPYDSLYDWVDEMIAEGEYDIKDRLRIISDERRKQGDPFLYYNVDTGDKWDLETNICYGNDEY